MEKSDKILTLDPPPLPVRLGRRLQSLLSDVSSEDFVYDPLHQVPRVFRARKVSSEDLDGWDFWIGTHPVVQEEGDIALPLGVPRTETRIPERLNREKFIEKTVQEIFRLMKIG